MPVIETGDTAAEGAGLLPKGNEEVAFLTVVGEKFTWFNSLLIICLEALNFVLKNAYVPNLRGVISISIEKVSDFGLGRPAFEVRGKRVPRDKSLFTF